MKKTKRWFIIVGSILLIVIYGIFCFWRYRNLDYTKQLQVSASSNDQTPTTLNVATYNVKLLNNGNDLNHFLDDINGLNLDIIGLQEVDQLAGRSKNMDMVKEMAQAAGYEYYYFYESMWLFDGYYGLGIMSKYPIIEVTSTALPAGTFSEPRILAGAKIDVNGKIIQVYNTHLNYFNRSIRDVQIEVICNLLKNQSNTIFLGDMNNFAIEDIFEIEGFKSLNTKDKTYVTFRDSSYTDNLYYSNDFDLQNIHVNQTSFSDHHLFWCKLHLQGEK